MNDFQNKKEEEKFYLSIFQNLYKEFPNGILDGHENPDFILTSGKKKIGIELTRIVNKKKERRFSVIEREAVWDRIAHDIELKLIENKIDPLRVMIIPGVTERLGSKRRELISKRLFDFIIRNLPSENSHFSLTNDFEDNNYFPFEISYVSILRINYNPSHHIFVTKGGWVVNDFIPELQQLIDEKNKKIYKSKIITDENWLVVYEKGVGGGTHYSPSVETQKHEYESFFNKIFYLETLQNRLFELKQKYISSSNLVTKIQFVSN